MEEKTVVENFSDSMKMSRDYLKGLEEKLCGLPKHFEESLGKLTPDVSEIYRNYLGRESRTGGKQEFRMGRSIRVPSGYLYCTKERLLELSGCIVELQQNALEKAFPPGRGRMGELFEPREVARPTFVLEWLLPLLCTRRKDDYSWLKKNVTHHKNFAGHHIPWRRSLHWTSLRFATATYFLHRRQSRQFYKSFMLLFSLHIAGKAAQAHEIMPADVVVLMLRAVRRKLEKIVTRHSPSASLCLAVRDSAKEICLIVCPPLELSPSNIGQSSDCLADVPVPVDVEAAGSVTFSAPKVDVPPDRLLDLPVRQNVASPKLRIGPLDKKLRGAPCAVLDSLVCEDGKLLPWQQHQDVFYAEEVVFEMVRSRSILEDYLSSLDHISEGIFGLCERYGRKLSHWCEESILSQEQWSRSILFHWCLVVLMDRVACKWDPTLKNYRLSIPIGQVTSRLLLQDRHAMETAVEMVSYAESRQNSEGMGSEGLFGSKGQILEYSLEYFERSQDMKNALTAENHRAQVREDDFNANILRLDRKIVDLENSICRTSCTCAEYDRHCYRCSYERQLNTLREQRRRPLIQPLPCYDHVMARKIIFFARLPLVLQAFGHVTGRAFNFRRNLSDEPKEVAPTSWRQYVVEHGFTSWTNSSTCLELVSTRKPKTQTHFRVEGIYYPDDLSVDIAWMISGEGLELWKNVVPMCIRNFRAPTRELVGCWKDEQWLINADHPENLVLARQNLVPRNMDRTQYQVFGNMRAAPHLQIQRLVIALDGKDGSGFERLLNQVNVRALVLQLMYEVGPISTGSRENLCHWEWKHDVFNAGWMKRLATILENFAMSIKGDWQQHRRLLLLVEMATYFYQFQKETFYPVLRACREVLRNWIADVKGLREKSGDQEVKASHKCRQYRFRLLFVLTFSGSCHLCCSPEKQIEEIAEQLQDLLCSIADASNLHELRTMEFCFPAVKEKWESSELAHLQQRAHHVLLAHQDAVHILLKREIGILESVCRATWDLTRGLHWERQEATSSYTASDEKGSLYEFCSVNGDILIDGWRIRSLPEYILKVPAYVEGFGGSVSIPVKSLNKGREFETVPDYSRDVKYSLSVVQESLRICETDKKSGETLVRVARKVVDSIGLPKKLVESYSHWLDRDRKLIYFRDRLFEHREKKLEMDLNTLQVRILEGRNEGSRLIPFAEACGIPSVKKVGEVLCQFDGQEYIHLYHTKYSSGCNLRFLLDRYDLSFTNDGSDSYWHSKEFLEHRLCLSGCLPSGIRFFPDGFKKYLLLEHPLDKDNTDYVVVVPVGSIEGYNIAYRTDREIEVPKYFHYEWSPALKCLRTASFTGRLYLAWLYSSFPSILPFDGDSAACGLEMAMELLRTCWKNWPYSHYELEILNEIRKVENRFVSTAALKLLVVYLLQESRRVGFLFGSETENPEDTSKLIKEYVERFSKFGVRIRMTAEEEDNFFEVPFEDMRDYQKPLKNKRHEKLRFFQDDKLLHIRSRDFKGLFQRTIFHSETVILQDCMGNGPISWLRNMNTEKHFVEKLFLALYRRALNRQLPEMELAYYRHHLLRIICRLDMSFRPEPQLALLDALSFVLLHRNSFPSADKYELAGLSQVGMTDVSFTEMEFHMKLYSRESWRWATFRRNNLDNRDRPLSRGPPNLSGLEDQLVKIYDSTRSELASLQKSKYLRRKFLEFLDDIAIICENLRSCTHDVSSMWGLPSKVDRPSWELESKAPLPWPRTEESNSSPRKDCCSGIESYEAKLDELCPLEEKQNLQCDEVCTNPAEFKCSICRKKLCSECNDYKHSPSRANHAKSEERIHAAANFKPFPFSEKGDFSDGIGKKLVGEMEESWEAWHVLCSSGKKRISRNAGAIILQMWNRAKQEAQEVMDRIHKKLRAVPAVLPEKLQALAEISWYSENLSYPTARQLLSILLPKKSSTPPFFSQYNPSLSPRDFEDVRQEVFHYAMLLVYKSWFRRLFRLSKSLDEQEGPCDSSSKLEKFLKEFSGRRRWNAFERPEWLLFEVENDLCIRSVQVDVAEQMLAGDERKEVLQLNMGEGKTKVIVPIISCLLANKTNLVRVNVLAPLEVEMYSYWHHVLGGLLGRKVYRFPFRRDMRISRNQIREAAKQVKSCKKRGGIILMTPECRLSLELKWRECKMDHRDSMEIDVHDMELLFKQEKVVEILDESDEILRLQFQLVYTRGSQQVLDEWKIRVECVQWIFRIFYASIVMLLHHKPEVLLCEYKWIGNATEQLKELGRFLLDSSHAICHFRGRKAAQYHQFPVLRLREISSSDLQKLYMLVVDVILRTEEFVGRIPDRFHEPFREFVLQNAEDTVDSDKHSTNKDILRRELNEVQYKKALILRGLLEHSVLQSCLRKRPHVDYGVDIRPGSRMMAVPFRGKDAPADRTEFAHPDVGIVQTVHSYYVDGLNDSQLRAAIVELKSDCNTNQREEEYRKWFQLSRHEMIDRDWQRIEKLDQVNVENEEIFRKIVEYFCHNMEVVNYYLKKKVFPREARQFPYRLMANAWDLAHGPIVVGFSGTNDTKYTLPLDVRQADLTSLRHTNGMMVDYLLLKQNSTYVALDEGIDEADRILDRIVNWKPDETPLSVLIDCGALMQGLSNKEVVKHVL